MYRCSVELSVRYDELSQSEREHASLIDEYTRLILQEKGAICVLIWTLDLLDWWTLIQFCSKMLPDWTFSSMC